MHEFCSLVDTCFAQVRASSRDKAPLIKIWLDQYKYQVINEIHAIKKWFYLKPFKVIMLHRVPTTVGLFWGWTDQITSNFSINRTTVSWENAVRRSKTPTSSSYLCKTLTISVVDFTISMCCASVDSTLMFTHDSFSKKRTLYDCQKIAILS